MIVLILIRSYSNPLGFQICASQFAPFHVSRNGSVVRMNQEVSATRKSLLWLELLNLTLSNVPTRVFRLNLTVESLLRGRNCCIFLKIRVWKYIGGGQRIEYVLLRALLWRKQFVKGKCADGRKRFS